MYTKPVLVHLSTMSDDEPRDPIEDELDTFANDWQKLNEHRAQLISRARILIQRALDHGYIERELAARLYITRTTLRRWIGK